MLWRVLIPLVFAAGVNAGGVYKWVDSDGNVFFSDRPQPGAEKITVHGLQTYRAPPLTSMQTDDAVADPSTSEGYKIFEFATPKSNQVFRDNGGEVPVALHLEPALQGGHKIRLLLDGANSGEGSSTSATLTNVDRGTHSLGAAVVDGDGKEVARTTVTFHLHRSGKKS